MCSTSYRNGDIIPAYLEVLDLTESAQWSTNMHVTTKPYFRYYCGVPLRTENDVNIGCLFVLDTEVKPAADLARIKLLTTCARNIMLHLQSVKEAQERRRTIHMNACIAEFIHPRNQIHRPRANSEDCRRPRLSQRGSSTNSIAQTGSTETTSIRTGSRSRSPSFRSTIDRWLVNATTPLETPSEGPAPSDPNPPEEEKMTEADHQMAFDRAASLLRRSLDLDLGGGVALFETTIASSGCSDMSFSRQNNTTYTEEGRDSAQFPKRSASDTKDGPISRVTTERPNAKPNYPIGSKERVVLAAASIVEADGTFTAYGRADSTYGIDFTSPDLRTLCQRYPKGKLITLSDQLDVTEFEKLGCAPAIVLSSATQYAIFLKRQFPEARQVIFVPMFHANFNRWTACFAYTTSPYRIFSYTTDYVHTLSFCNAVRTEIVRLATGFANQQKGEFIGSISHELRSPLHGLMASIEFLQDTDCTTFQRSCLDTADSCAQTLMDTVTMVLDYSKANHLKRKQSDGDSSSEASENMPIEKVLVSHGRVNHKESVDSWLDCDIAFLLEDTVNGMAVAHVARQKMMPGADEVTELNATLVDLAVRPELHRVICAVRPDVETILDIDSSVDWYYRTQPGAVRRIITNLYGNSLKYTKHGYITLMLRIVDDPRALLQVSKSAAQPQTIVKLSVTDTGRGISPAFLKNKLFSEFSQEDMRSAGSGLGLSIVKSLIIQLDGEVEIKSVLNVGTVVTVILPMTRSSPTKNMRASVLSNTQSYHVEDPSVNALKKLPFKPQVAIYEPALELDSFGQTQGALAVHAAVKRILSGWFQFPTLETWNCDAPAKVLIVDEVHLPTLLAQRPDFLDTLSRQSLVILAADSARNAILCRDIRSKQVEIISKPFGPYKLARAICQSLEKAALSARTATEAEYVEVRATREGAGSPHPTPRLRNISSSTIVRDDKATPGSILGFSTSPISPKTTSKTPQVAQEGTSCWHGVVQGPDGGFPFPLQDTVLETIPPSQPVPTVTEDHSRTPSPPRRRASNPNIPTRLRPRMDTMSTESLSMDEDLVIPASATPTSNVGAWVMETPRPTPIDKPPPKPRILLVDDNKINLQMLHTFVRKKGYQNDVVDLADDGAKAVDIFKRQTHAGYPPAIVFMDISMPVMDGYEATRAIRHFKKRRMAEDGSVGRPRSLIVAVTGNASGTYDQTEAFESGVDIYMTKPVSFKEMGKILETWRE